MAAVSTSAAHAHGLDAPYLAVPLRVDADGMVRVAGTRVTLETVAETFDEGASPEEISRAFPVLGVEDVYAVIAYYLANRDTVQAYIREQEAAAEEVRRDIEEKMARREAQHHKPAEPAASAAHSPR